MSDNEENNKQPSTHLEHGVPVFHVQSEAERKQAAAEARRQKYEDDQITLNRRLVGATLALVAVTLALAVASGIQLWYMHRQWKLTSDGLSKTGDQIWAAKDAAFAARQAATTGSNTLGQMQAQTKAQQDAAKAAGRTVNNAQVQFRDEQRPYLFTEVRGGFKGAKENESTIVQLDGDGSGGAIAAIAIDASDTGKSPAVDVVMPTTKIIVAPEKSVIAQIADFRPDYGSVKGTGTLAVGEKVTIPSNPLHLTKDEVDRLHDGTLTVAIVGGIQYRDMFSPRIKPYETTYCYFVAPIGMAIHECDFGKGHFGAHMK